MASLTVIDRDAAAAFVQADPAGDDFINDGLTELVIVNGSLSAVTVTAVADGECSQDELHDLTHAVPPGNLYRFGPFTHRYYSRTDSRVRITYSATTGVTVEARRLR